MCALMAHINWTQVINISFLKGFHYTRITKENNKDTDNKFIDILQLIMSTTMSLP